MASPKDKSNPMIKPKVIVGSIPNKQITAEETHKEPKLEEEPKVEEPSELGEQVAEEVVGQAPEVQMVNEALVETVAKVIGKTTALLTRIPEMDFDESEVEQLKNLWAPLIPKISPLLLAFMGTSIIVLGKVAIYASERKKKEPMKEEKLETGIEEQRG